MWGLNPEKYSDFGVSKQALGQSLGQSVKPTGTYYHGATATTILPIDGQALSIKMPVQAIVADALDAFIANDSTLYAEPDDTRAAAALLRLSRKRPLSCEANDSYVSSSKRNTTEFERNAEDSKPKRPYQRGGHQRMARVNDLLMSFMDEMLQTEEKDREAFYKRLTNLDAVKAAGVGRLEIVSWFKRARKKMKQEELKAAEDAERRSKDSGLCRGHLVVPTLGQSANEPAPSPRREKEDYSMKSSSTVAPSSPPLNPHSMTALAHSWEFPCISADNFRMSPLPPPLLEHQSESIASIQDQDLFHGDAADIGKVFELPNSSQVEHSARPFSSPVSLGLQSPEPPVSANATQSSVRRLVVPIPPRHDYCGKPMGGSGATLSHISHNPTETISGFGRIQTTSSFRVPTLTVPIPRNSQPSSQPCALSLS